jgi:hypothetical protein
MPVEERFWLNRLRWRMRGAAWLWPAFALFVVIDAALLHWLPPVNPEDPVGPQAFTAFGNLIIASFGNLFLVAVVAPWLARRLAERPVPEGEEKPPYELFLGRAGATLMALGAFGLLVAGLATRPTIVSETRATEDNARVVRDYVFAKGTPEMRRNLGSANTVRMSEGFFRTCIARDDRRLAFCFFVNTKNDPATLRPDPDSRPNGKAVRR